MDTNTRKLAITANKLFSGGIRGKDAAKAMSLTKSAYGTPTQQANQLAVMGHALKQLDTYNKTTFTAPEILLIKTVARLTRELREDGRVGSPESKHVSWAARKSNGWAVRTAMKRIGGRVDELREHPMALVAITGNGYISLTELGWMVVNAINSTTSA